MTKSTHISVPKLRVLEDTRQRDYVETVQESMRETIAQLAPEWTSIVAESVLGSRN